MISYPFISLSELKAYLDVPDNVTKLDLRFRLLLASAQAQIEKATARVFTRQTITEFFTSRDNRHTDYDFGSVADFGYGVSSYASSGLATVAQPQTIYLSGIGIDPNEDLSVWYDPRPVDSSAYGPTALLTPVDDYQVDFAEDSVVLRIGTTYAPRALKVAYTAGYAFAASEDDPDNPTLSDALPDTLKLAIMTQVQFLNVKLRTDNINMGSERTISVKDRVHSAPFIVTSGLAPEVSSLIGDLKRLRLGTS